MGGSGFCGILLYFELSQMHRHSPLQKSNLGLDVS